MPTIEITNSMLGVILECMERGMNVMFFENQPEVNGT